jgi:hypothetical protein
VTTRCRSLRNKRHRRTRAVAAAIATAGIAACGSARESVTSESIVDRAGAPSSKVANSSFEEPTLWPWQVAGQKYARVVVTRELSWEGQQSAKIRARGRRVRGSVILGQIVPRVAEAAPGTRYRLVVRVRTRGLNRRGQVELKLIYSHGKYDFYLGHAVAGSPGLPKSGQGIPPGTWRRWITVKVDAVAKRRVRAIQVFAFDSGPGPLRGTVWIDSVELSGRNPEAR